MDHVLEYLSEYAASLSYDKLPREVVHSVKRRVIDALGCALGAYGAEPPSIARAHALEVTAKPGATLLGTRHHTAPELAAFVNGVMTRYLDYNDTGMGPQPGAGHPSDNIPAVLAAADYAGADGRTAICGIVLAYEVQGRFADTYRIGDVGWDHVTYLAVASAAGAGKAMGLTREKLANAIALAAIPNFSLYQTRVGHLSMWKGCAAGNASRNGVFAALMARRGLTGPQEAFEGSKGFLKKVATPADLPLFGGDGRSFKIEFAKFKFFPVEYEAQCAIEPAILLHHDLGGRVDDIEKVKVETYAVAVNAAADTRDKWAPKSRETADHSLPYVLSVALSSGGIWLDDFAEERIRDPKLHDLMQKIEVRSTEECDRAFPEGNCYKIEVITRSGKRLLRETRYAKGHPKNPMTDQDIETKFRKLTGPVMKPKQVDAALARLWHLEEMRDAREIPPLFEVTK